MRGLLLPATTLLNRLKYIQKFMLIFVLFMLSVGFAVYLLVADINEGIEVSELERQGVAYNNQIRILLEHLQQHRGLSNALLNGEETFKATLLQKQGQVAEDIERIDQMDPTVILNLRTKESWSLIKEQWRAIHNRFILTPEPKVYGDNEIIGENFELHTAVISDLLAHMIYVAHTSHLLIDPDPDSYRLMDNLVNKLPLLIETTGQLRGLGSGIAAKKVLTSDEKIQLIVRSGMLHSAMNQLRNQQHIFSKGSLNTRIHAYIDHNLVTTQSLLDMLQKEIIEANAIHIQPSVYYEEATKAMDAGFRNYDIASPSLDQLLNERIERLTNQKMITIVFSSSVILLIFMLFWAFYESVITTVLTLQRASARFAMGDLSIRVELASQDELKHVGLAFNKMADAFGSMITERKQYEEKIEYQAFHDSLTDLPNRALLNIRFSQALTDVLRNKELLVVMFLDLDRFKMINDTLGHEKGDLLLKEVANRLRNCFDQDDIVFRMGGDEFLFFFSNVQSIEVIEELANQILVSLSKPIKSLSNDFFVSTSIGISLFPADGDNIETLVKNADVAMYAAKKDGGNNYRFYNHKMGAQ